MRGSKMSTSVVKWSEVLLGEVKCCWVKFK